MGRGGKRVQFCVVVVWLSMRVSGGGSKEMRSGEVVGEGSGSEGTNCANWDSGQTSTRAPPP